MAKGQEGAAVDTAADIRGWCLGRLPDGWFAGPPEVTVDREEITVVGQLPPVTGSRRTPGRRVRLRRKGGTLAGRRGRVGGRRGRLAGRRGRLPGRRGR